MSTEQLHEMAENDTPSNVNVPQDWRALMVWAVGRFGVGIVVAWVFWQAWREERQESHARTDRLMTLLEGRAKVDAEMTTALDRLRTMIDEVAKDAREAHRPR